MQLCVLAGRELLISILLVPRVRVQPYRNMIRWLKEPACCTHKTYWSRGKGEEMQHHMCWLETASEGLGGGGAKAKIVNFG